MSGGNHAPLNTDKRFGRLPVEVCVELTRVRMTAGDIASLSIHDIIPLGHVEEHPVTLSVRGYPFASGELGMASDSLVVKVLALNSDDGHGTVAGEE